LVTSDQGHRHQRFFRLALYLGRRDATGQAQGRSRGGGAGGEGEHPGELSQARADGEAIKRDHRVVAALEHTASVGVDWLIWRIVRSGKGSLTDLKTSWTLHDLFDAHAVIDFEDAQHEAMHDLMEARAKKAAAEQKLRGR
jgi:hypothetical protein